VGTEIVCHPGEHVTAIALSADGALLVTASNVGMHVKLIDTKQRTVLRIFTRGYFSANIMCLGISRDCKWVCVASDKTIHVFDRSTKDGGKDVMFKPPGGNFVCTFGGRPQGDCTHVYAVCPAFFSFCFGSVLHVERSDVRWVMVCTAAAWCQHFTPPYTRVHTYCIVGC
jgi:WD40 repeat protein